jgi:uncharacterized membrane protein
MTPVKRSSDHSESGIRMVGAAPFARHSPLVESVGGERSRAAPNFRGFDASQRRLPSLLRQLPRRQARGDFKLMQAPILLPTWLVATSALLAASAVVAALRGIDWRRLRDFEAQAVFAVVLGLSVAARLARIELQPGLDLHLFGASAAALMFGWRFALLGQALAVAIVAALWQRYWLSPLLDFVYTGLVPVLVTTALLDFAQRRFPLHLFVYLLFNAFFAGALAIAIAQVGKLLTLVWLGAYALPTLSENFLLTVPALMFPEGFATGAMLTMVVAYRPQWAATFHDASYLGVAPR